MKDDRKSKESPALAAQLRAFSVISSSLRAELSTSRNHSVGKVSAFADESSDRSHPLTVYQRYCGRRRLLRHRPLPQCLSGSHVRSALPFHQNSTIRARAGKTIISRLDLHTVRLLPRLSACLLTLRKTERTMLPHRPFRLPPSRAMDIFTLLIQCIMEPHHTQGVRTKSIFISNRKHSRASATRFIRIVFRFDILMTAINTLYATYVVKTCNALSPYA